MKRINKFKWLWIKFWGYRYITISPNNVDKEFILYHKRIYDKQLWDNHFKEASI